jgi:hypothetical protein
MTILKTVLITVIAKSKKETNRFVSYRETYEQPHKHFIQMLQIIYNILILVAT